jgi:FkbM family methyltransferase
MIPTAPPPGDTEAGGISTTAVGSPNVSTPSEESRFRTPYDKKRKLTLIKNTLIAVCGSIFILTLVASAGLYALTLDTPAGHHPAAAPVQKSVVPEKMFDGKTFVDTFRNVRLEFISIESPQFYIYNDERMINWVTSQYGEIEITKRLKRLIKGLDTPTSRNVNEWPLMLDIGSNIGYYGLMAASGGKCRVNMYDIQPSCWPRLEAAIAINGFSPFIRVIRKGVGNDTDKQISVTSGADCWGKFSQDQAFLKSEARRARNFNLRKHADMYTVPMTTIDQELGHVEDVFFVKIDTEGNEGNVLAGASESIRKKVIRNLVVEITPMFYDKLGVSREFVASQVYNIVDSGYTMEVLRRKNPGIIQSPDAAREFILHEDFNQLDFWFSA